ncbi:Mur ligase family protein [Elongatibacter sediminis]|uniref:Mur ligase family protein n=1 Tax=Elongatibacter sediminis TaxID=3119006 RepID=A0AAW9RK01_9GAMM
MHIPETLLLIGPNRRSDRTLLEQQLVPDREELRKFADGGETVIRELTRIGPWLAGEWDKSPVAAAAEPLAAMVSTYNQLALALQRHSGHRVDESGFQLDSAGNGVWAWFEYEHDEVGRQAAELALRLIAAAGGAGDSDAGPTPDTAAAVNSFLEFATQYVQPRDTEAIVAAAARLDIPCYKLERDPYPGLEGDFRIRRNGLLMLGHARFKQIVDGTFCVSRCARIQSLVRDREALRSLLATWKVPLPSRDPSAGNCLMTRRALRAAESIGYPVVLRPAMRTDGVSAALDLQIGQEVAEAVDHMRHRAQTLVVEAMVPGTSHKILVAGGEPLAVISGGKEFPPDEVHADTLELARNIARRLDAGLVAVDIVSRDIGHSLETTGGAVVDVDLAPDLDHLLAPESPLFGECATRFLRWLFPAGEPARIPVLTVTGTNGKTTTCRMITRILEHAGKHTGMVCSEGLYFGEQFETRRATADVAAHHWILETETVEAAVFEEYFGRIARLGFTFRWCDVAVCTNVTDDHLGRIGTHTLEEMAALKQAVPVRAREAAVLNGDDPRCRAMASACTARKVCLISIRASLEQEVAELGERGARAVLEPANDGRRWLVLHDGPERLPVLPVDEIPATFGGSAPFNVSNALHAAAAAYFGGAQIPAIASGLRSFEMSYENTPGRLNRFDGLPFSVIMDYAHNADGFRQIARFVDQQNPAGKRRVMVGFTGDRRDEAVLAAIAELAGHFDHYVCRNFMEYRGRKPHEIPQLLNRGLLAAGVPREQIDVVPDAVEAVHHVLDAAQPGDFVVLLCGSTQFDSVWNHLHERAGLEAPVREESGRTPDAL